MGDEVAQLLLHQCLALAVGQLACGSGLLLHDMPPPAVLPAMRHVRHNVWGDAIRILPCLQCCVTVQTCDEAYLLPVATRLKVKVL
jgi:hypothetical protein